MDAKALKNIGHEIDVVVRVRSIPEAQVIRELLSYIDFYYHGVIPHEAQEEEASQQDNEGSSTGSGVSSESGELSNVRSGRKAGKGASSE